MIKIVVLLSGNGSTFQAIADRCQQEPGVIEIAAVISNKANAYGLVRAQATGIKTEVLEPQQFVDSKAYHLALQNLIDSYLTEPEDLIILAGYMRILSPDFVSYFKGRILNIHPSLLPKFPGLHTHAKAIEAGEKEHGSTIHIVTAELDAGPIVDQGKVAINFDDTPESLEEKVKVLERQLYPDTLFRLAKNFHNQPPRQPEFTPCCDTGLATPPLEGNSSASMKLSRTYFISDLHLSEDNPGMTNAFLGFLKNEASQADALYILGDLFDVWIGDDNQTPFTIAIANALQAVSERGIKIYFMAGNRDFLLKDGYAKLCGMTILPDPTVIKLYNTNNVLLMHGDLLCTHDLKYQAFRRQASKGWLQFLFLSLPLFIRRYIAKSARQKSRSHTRTVNRQIQDVVQKTVEQYMNECKSHFLMHGHTHLPAIHNFMLNNESAIRIVLAAWHGEGSALCYESTGQFFCIKIAQ